MGLGQRHRIFYSYTGTSFRFAILASEPPIRALRIFVVCRITPILEGSRIRRHKPRNLFASSAAGSRSSLTGIAAAVACQSAPWRCRSCGQSGEAFSAPNSASALNSFLFIESEVRARCRLMSWAPPTVFQPLRMRVSPGASHGPLTR